MRSLCTTLANKSSRLLIREFCSTQNIVTELTQTLDEHKTKLKKLSDSEKREAIRLKLKKIEQENGNFQFYDMFMRHHTYLRISLTEKCNFRCLYCMPADGVPLKPKHEMLTNDEIIRLVKLFAAHGIDKIRLTGGEPTIRKDIVQIVEQISSTNGIKSVGLTTNGLVLQRFLPDLIKAGLTKVNISIDSLNKKKFAQMTRRDAFDKVFKSIQMAQNLLPTVKLNVVVIRDQNDMEIIDFIDLTKTNNFDIRFIEFMPFGGNEFSNNRFIGYREMLEKVVEKYGKNVKRLQDSPNDTTKAYKIDGYKGQFGFITSMSEHFCNTCNRLRITADGNLKVCLFGNTEVSLRDKLRGGVDDSELSKIIQVAVNNKKAKHAEDFRNERSSKYAKSSNDFNRWIKNPKILSSFSNYFNFLSIRHFSSSSYLFKSSLHSSQSSLTHVDSTGSACQVDVSHKLKTTRIAIAQGTIVLTPEVSKQISENTIKKGDVLTVAKIASLLGAKYTSTLIPLCHPIYLDFIDTTFDHDTENFRLTIRSTAKCNGNTGVEMEALTACSIAMLTVYDMCKAISHQMVLTDIRLVHKSGGKSVYNYK